MAFLGMAELDRDGNVNVSYLAGRFVGPGGFIDITQHAKKVVFCGVFETKGADIAVVEGRLEIRRHGEIRKLVDRVAHITFSGEQARLRGQNVVYVTERAVFRLLQDGVELIEIAPGVDLQTDILDRMAFTPVIRDVRRMPEALFRP